MTNRFKRKLFLGCQYIWAFLDEVNYQTIKNRPLAKHMQYTTLGRTGLKVSVMGLGSGGSSQLGLAKGHGKKHAIRIIHRALDHGICFIDTARIYGNEAIVGEAIADRRDRIVISTKQSVNFQGGRISAQQFSRAIDKSLADLKTDHIDIFSVHGVEPDQYDYVLQTLVPALISARNAGKIGFIGITEAFSKDTQHTMLERALQDSIWDVMMVGFNLLNQTARQRIIYPAKSQGFGVVGMFAVRNALRHPKYLRSTLNGLIKSGVLLSADLDRPEIIIDKIIAMSSSGTLPEVAYRYCRHGSAVDLVLFGTSHFKNLDNNVKTLLEPPLSDRNMQFINEVFSAVHDVSGD